MKNIAVIAWGDSSEYEVSLQSAKNICDALSWINEYRVFPIICKWKKWIYEIGGESSIEVDKNDFSLVVGFEKSWNSVTMNVYIRSRYHWPK